MKLCFGTVTKAIGIRVYFVSLTVLEEVVPNPRHSISTKGLHFKKGELFYPHQNSRNCRKSKQGLLGLS